jgi:transcriptional regulator
MAHLNDLTNLNEGERQEPWHLTDAPHDFIEKLSHAIVGVRMEVRNLIGCWKMIQHRTEGDRSGTIAGLLNSNDFVGREVAKTMQSLESNPGS